MSRDRWRFSFGLRCRWGRLVQRSTSTET
ncbi:hypothetical protein LINPERPRIM_LOCUS12217 [Linum perenne]